LPHQRAASGRARAAGRLAEADRAHGVRGHDHLLPRRRAARPGAALADLEGEAPALAFPVLIDSERRQRMNANRWLAGLLTAALVALPMVAPAMAQTKEMFVPSMVYRTGPYAPSGTPLANGFWDYMTLINERDGGVNGVKLLVEECETQYDT